MCVQCGNSHFLSLAEVFSIFFPIVTPVCKSPNKKAVKVRCLPLRPKDFLIFCILSFIPHYWALSNNLLLSFDLLFAPPPLVAAICPFVARMCEDGSLDDLFTIVRPGGRRMEVGYR